MDFSSFVLILYFWKKNEKEKLEKKLFYKIRIGLDMNMRYLARRGWFSLSLSLSLSLGVNDDDDDDNDDFWTQFVVNTVLLCI